MAQLTMKFPKGHIEKTRQRFMNALTLSPVHDQGADLSQWCGAVFNQLQEGSCTACTTRDYLLWLENRYEYSPVVEPDVQALYYFGRKIFGDLNIDGGSTIHDAFQAAIQYGVWPASAEVYDRSTLFTEPTGKPAFKALSQKDLQPTTTNIRASLDSGVPLGIAVGVDETLFRPADTPDGYVGVVDVYSTVEGEGHAMFVVGYTPHPTYKFLYRTQNSWGTDYGDKGFIWLTEAYLDKYLFELGTLDILKTFKEAA